MVIENFVKLSTHKKGRLGAGKKKDVNKVEPFSNKSKSKLFRAAAVKIFEGKSPVIAQTADRSKKGDAGIQGGAEHGSQPAAGNTCHGNSL